MNTHTLYIYIHVHIHLHIRMYTYTYIHIHIHNHIHIHIHMHIYICMHMVGMHTYVHTYIRTHIHTDILAFTQCTFVGRHTYLVSLPAYSRHQYTKSWSLPDSNLTVRLVTTFIYIYIHRCIFRISPDRTRL